MNGKTSVMCIAFVVSACADSGSSVFPFSPEAGSLATFADAFEVVDRVVLEERPANDVVIAMPMVRFDGTRFVIADVYAHRVFIYEKDGRLVEARGQAGEGPGEFTSPISARRTPTGGLLVTDYAQSRLTLFPQEAETDPETMPVPFSVPVDAIDLGNRRYLVAALSVSSATEPVLHVWNAESEAVERSFFTPPRPDYLDGMAESRGEFVSVIINDEAIWVVSAFTDSAFVLGMDGTQARAIPFPLAPQPPRDAPERWEVDRMYVLGNGNIVVELGIRVGRQRDISRQHLMVLDSQGRPLAVLANTPRLFVVADDLFYFQNPDRIEPNHWIVARWRAS